MLTINPQPSPKAIVLWLHGLGADQNDFVDFINEMLSKIRGGVGSHDLSVVNSVLRMFKPKVRHNAISVLDDDQNLCTTAQGVAKAFRQYFASLMKGKVVTFESLVRQAQANELNRNNKQLAEHLSIQHLPNYLRIVHGMLKVKGDRAPGGDCLVPELLKTCAASLAWHLLPIFLKAHMRISPPIQYTPNGI